jgi:phosphopantothenate-cysteine ligase
MHREPTTFSAESYFETQLPPVTLQHDVENVCEFVERQQKEGRNVVLVTVSISTLYRSMNALKLLFFGSIKSGGTSVPLELNV